MFVAYGGVVFTMPVASRGLLVGESSVIDHVFEAQDALPGLCLYFAALFLLLSSILTWLLQGVTFDSF